MRAAGTGLPSQGWHMKQRVAWPPGPARHQPCPPTCPPGSRCFSPSPTPYFLPELVSVATGATCKVWPGEGGREQGGAIWSWEASPWGRSTGSRAAPWPLVSCGLRAWSPWSLPRVPPRLLQEVVGLTPPKTRAKLG